MDLLSKDIIDIFDFQRENDLCDLFNSKCLVLEG